MLKKNINLIFIILFIFLITQFIYADYGESGWVIFKKAQSSRFKGISAVSSIPGNLAGVFYNPALLNTCSHRAVFLISELGFAEDKLGGILYYEPLGKSIIAGGIVYYDAGQIELNWIEYGKLKTDDSSAERDLFGILSYGYQLQNNFSIGLSLKIARSDLIQREAAVAFASDFGFIYMPVKDLLFSVAIQNLGLSTKFIDKENPLPSSGYIGSGYFYQTGYFYLLSALGAVYNWQDKEILPEMGIEFGYNFISMNIGYRFNIEEAKWHFGLGAMWKNIECGYAYIPASYLNATHRISIGYKFGVKTLKE